MFQVNISFFKYQGTGNDFIMIDNRLETFPKKDTKLIRFLCDRRFGIGGDGLILIESDKMTDFRMVYYNSDGNESTMCGNGGRCIVAFAHQLGMIQNETQFLATDGVHRAMIEKDQIALQMIDVDVITEKGKDVFLNTGSPHHVIQVDHIDTLDVVKSGSAIRYSEMYQPDGTNVNFVKQLDDGHIRVRTYERGVENETFSCGTGVTASVLALHHLKKISQNTIGVEVLGGKLHVSFEWDGTLYKNIFLKGPAQKVFEGIIQIDKY